jgi:SAM-dependent methyltransferase
VTAAERLANDSTSELWGEHRSRYRFAAQFVQGKQVLDVASGAGFGLAMLRAAGAWAVGMDYALSSLCDARKMAPSAPLVHGDATRIPLRDRVFDVVVSFETLEHVPDAETMVREVRRVLRPGGALVLSTPNRSFGPEQLHVNNPFHVREFTAAELDELLRSSFATVTLYGQRPTDAFRFVPYLMVGRDVSPRAIAWKLMARLPFALRDRIAFALSGRPFYPGEEDYAFVADTHGAHALVAVAR